MEIRRNIFGFLLIVSLVVFIVPILVGTILIVPPVLLMGLFAKQIKL